jgi:hypothetical protein
LARSTARGLGRGATKCRLAEVRCSVRDMPTQPLPSRNQMLGFILRFIQDGNRGEDVTVKHEFQGDFLVLFGIIQRVRHFPKRGFGSRRQGSVPKLECWFVPPSSTP